MAPSSFFCPEYSVIPASFIKIYVCVCVFVYKNTHTFSMELLLHFCQKPTAHVHFTTYGDIPYHQTKRFFLKRISFQFTNSVSVLPILCLQLFSCIYVCVTHACLVPLQIRRGSQVPWHWNY